MTKTININLNNSIDEDNKIFADILDPNKWDEFIEELKINSGDTESAINKIFLRKVTNK